MPAPRIKKGKFFDHFGQKTVDLLEIQLVPLGDVEAGECNTD